MSVREYIGARYVPLFMGEWNSSNTYEPLSVVQYQGNSYTSRQYVPAGVAITDNVYWAETGNFNAQIEAYRQEVLAFDGRITANADDISILYESHKPIAENRNYYILSDVFGNDDNAHVVYDYNDESAAYKTLDHAMDDAALKGNEINFRFVSPGTYYLHNTTFCGTVIHFYAITAGVKIVLIPNDINNTVYFYDNHLNVGTNSPSNPIEITVQTADDDTTKKGFQTEGSFSYFENAIINCSKFLAVQGSCYFNNCTLNGRVECSYAFARIANLTIKDTSTSFAFFSLCANLRFEGNTDSLIIADNPNSTNPAIRVLSSNVSIVPGIHSENNARLSYPMFFDARFSTVHGELSTFAAFNNYAQGNSQLYSNSELISSNRMSEHGSVTNQDIPAGSYIDIPITFTAPFQEIPFVAVNMASGSTSPEIGNMAACAINKNRSGFTIRVFNNGSSQRTPTLDWYAIS